MKFAKILPLTTLLTWRPQNFMSLLPSLLSFFSPIPPSLPSSLLPFLLSLFPSFPPFLLPSLPLSSLLAFSFLFSFLIFLSLAFPVLKIFLSHLSLSWLISITSFASFLPNCLSFFFFILPFLISLKKKKSGLCGRKTLFPDWLHAVLIH